MEIEEKIFSIEDYNNYFGFKTKHPLVAYVEFNAPTIKSMGKHTYSFYSLWLKETKGCIINYGKTKYDFDGQTIVSTAPNQEVGYTTIKGIPAKAKGILFHPDFLRGTSLEKKIKSYNYFSYDSNEALHLSADEQQTISSCMKIIETELKHPIDHHTKGLICTNIELILDYCLRFYERQFITRQDLNITTISRFNQLVHEYIYSGKTEKEGLPTVKYFADKVCLSANYFGDLVKAETGKTAQEYISLQLYDYAKSRLESTNQSIKEISIQLGFQHPQHFVRFFKKQAGITPSEFRKSN